MNLFDFTNRVVVITGASSGIGKDAAFAFADHGADVVVLARRKEKLDVVVNEINERHPNKAFAITCDVTNEDNVKEAVEKVKARYGKIDVLFNNAGVAIRGDVTTNTNEEWDQAISVNVKGIVHMSKYVVPMMKDKAYGRIINTASVNAVLADKSSVLWRHTYNTTKAGVIGLTKAMAASYTQFGITTNAIGPGLFESEMTKDTLFKSEEFLTMYNALCPASRPGYKGELNAAILFFASSGAGYVSGQYLLIDGGFSIV